MNGRGSDATNQAVLELHDSHSQHQNSSLNALELLAQMPKTYQANEQQSQHDVDKNALPSLTLDDKPYLASYQYTRAEAEAHKKEILQSGNMSENDIVFLRTMLKQEKKEQEIQSSDITRWSGVKSNGHQTEAATNKHEPLSGDHISRKFELSSEAENNAWKEWQVRLNKQIGQSLDKLVEEGKIPPGAKGSASYTVAADGRFVFSCTAEPAAYARVIAAALNNTFNNHRELLQFPEGAHRLQISRTPGFSVGAHSSVITGAVEDEVIKK